MPAELLLEFYEDAWEAHAALVDMREKHGSRFGEYDRERLRELEKMLGLVDDVAVSDDPLADKWDREIAEGKIPNLDEMPP